MKTIYAYWLSFALAILTAVLNAYGFWMIHVEQQEYPIKLGIADIAVFCVLLITLIIVSFKQWWRVGIILNLVASHLFLFFLVMVFVVQWALYGTTLGK
jgi:hypothetical protein